MKRYIGRRLIQLIPILLGVSWLTFILMHVSAMDAVDIMEQNTGSAWTEMQKQAVRAELGLDQPLMMQYVSWLKGIVSGDMGKSYISGKPVFGTFLAKLPATIYLMISAIFLTLIISIPLGMMAAAHRNSFIDYLIRLLSFIGNAMPNFFMALLLMFLFALKLRWLPVMGNMGEFKSIILPAVTLSLAMASKYTRQVRAAVLEEMNKEYIVAAYARGIRKNNILYGSVLRVVMLQITTLLALSIGSLLGGTAIIESIFMWDGVGKMAVDAILARDYPVIQAYVIWMAVIYVMINLAADMICHWIDPRIRLKEA